MHKFRTDLEESWKKALLNQIRKAGKVSSLVVWYFGLPGKDRSPEEIPSGSISKFIAYHLPSAPKAA